MRNWLTFIVVAWGAVQLGMAFVSAWYWLVVCRILLGAFEVTLLIINLFACILTDIHLGVFISISTFHNDNMVCYTKSGCVHC